MPWKATNQTKTIQLHGQQLHPRTNHLLLHRPLARETTSTQNKHDDDLCTTSSSIFHSGTQAFEFTEDDDLYFNMKQPATTNFPENKTQPTAQHIFNCNMGHTTVEDVTATICQSIEHQPVQQQELMVVAPTPQNVESVTMRKK